jgi:hypothetical protein
VARPLALTLTLFAILAGCGGERSTRAEDNPTRPVIPIAGNLLDASSFDPIEQQTVTVPANGSREVPLEFGSVKAGSVILITDHHEDLRATVGGVPFREGDLFGVPAYFVILLRPGAPTLLLENGAAEKWRRGDRNGRT